jgi:hypothetical protein
VKDQVGGIDRLKNRSGKCEGSGEGDRCDKNRNEKCVGPAGGGVDRLKNRSGKCEGPAEGVNGLKNRSGKCEGPGRGGDQ